MKTKYDELTFTNNFMFCQILQNNPDLCKDIIEVILDIKIKGIVKVSGEESISITEDGHGIRLDVYVEDEEHSVYDIEMQTINTGNLPKRSRYYQGIIDLSTLDRGENYDLLRKSYVIFINTFDPFGHGRYKYTFRNTCVEELGLELKDDAFKVFINAKGVSEGASPEMKDLLNYITSGETKGNLSREIEKHLQLAKQNKDWRLRYMTFDWELARERREGREEGRMEGRVETLKLFLDKLHQSDLIEMGFTEEEINQAKEMK